MGLNHRNPTPLGTPVLLKVFVNISEHDTTPRALIVWKLIKSFTPAHAQGKVNLAYCACSVVS